MDRPNVLLLYTDQQRWDALGASGNPLIHTPNLDALAAGGAMMEMAFCNNTVCMPSRQSMLSGQYPSTVGCTCNGIEMPHDVLTLHRVLGSFGYHTAQLGKLHFLNHAHRDHRELHPDYGFDEMVISDEPGCYDDAYIKWVEAQAPGEVWNCRCSTPPARRTDVIDKGSREAQQPYVFEGPEHLTHTAFVASETIRSIRTHAGRPWFAIAGFYAPHAPLNPPQRFVDMYDPAELPGPIMNEGENQYGLSDEQWRNVKAHYYALVTHVDNQVGRILTALDELGQRGNTLILFTADHGEHLGDHGLVGKGPPDQDSCAHVPMILSLPGRIAAQRRDELIEQVDVAPTVLDYCGVQTPPQFQGRSFRPLLDGGEYQPRDSVYIEYRQPFEPHRTWKTLRTRKFKYSICADGTERLLDLEKDPHELTNLVYDSEYAAALAEMRAELVRRWFTVESQYPLRTGIY